MSKCRARDSDLKLSPFFVNPQEGKEFWPVHQNYKDLTKVFRERTKLHCGVGGEPISRQVQSI